MYIDIHLCKVFELFDIEEKQVDSENVQGQK